MDGGMVGRRMRGWWIMMLSLMFTFSFSSTTSRQCGSWIMDHGSWITNLLVVMVMVVVVMIGSYNSLFHSIDDRWFNSFTLSLDGRDNDDLHSIPIPIPIETTSAGTHYQWPWCQCLLSWSFHFNIELFSHDAYLGAEGSGNEMGIHGEVMEMSLPLLVVWWIGWWGIGSLDYRIIETSIFDSYYIITTSATYERNPIDTQRTTNNEENNGRGEWEIRLWNEWDDCERRKWKNEKTKAISLECECVWWWWCELHSIFTSSSLSLQQDHKRPRTKFEYTEEYQWNSSINNEIDLFNQNQ